MSRDDQPRAPGHPTIGLVSIAPIPGAEQESTSTLRQGGPMPVVELQPGITLGIVLEVGPRPDEAHEQLVPYSVGATVTYATGSEIRVGGTHYVPMGKIISWREEALDA